MVSLLEGCSEACGWTAAIVAVLFFGSFGVPVKVNTNVEVNFFVMQSYKTVVCFLTSWLVIFLGEPVRFSPWGIVSGLFWVPGASCGIYAIRNAGVATAVGTWSAIQVCSSFFFGIVVFQEQVKDFKQTMVAFLLLMTGLVGMSVYSDSSKNPTIKTVNTPSDYEALPTTDTTEVTSKRLGIASSTSMRSIILRNIGKRENRLPSSIAPVLLQPARSRTSLGAETLTDVPCKESKKLNSLQIDENIVLLDQFSSEVDEKLWHNKDRVEIFGGRIGLPRRQMGILAAVVNGAWGGMCLIPLHYARRDQGLSGAGYLISYGSGSMLVCAAIWFGMFVHYFIREDYNAREALNRLPAWHLRELGIPGFMAGILYSTGNFGSILAVTYLGQAVGYSFCQGQLLVSGLWGVCYFGEIQGRGTIAKWFASAVLTVVGIIWLSCQHDGAHGH